jgi:chemotaxis methyl-accepting protein methylase
MGLEAIPSPKPNILENSTIERLAAEQYPAVEYIVARAAKTIEGCFPQLKSLIAPELVALTPGQVPKLRTLNASYSRLDLRLADFPSLREVYCSAIGWKYITEEMRVKGWHYKNGQLVHPLRERGKYKVASLLGKNRNEFVDGLVAVHGEGIRDFIRDLEEDQPEILPAEIVARIEAGSTCQKTDFFREPNIAALADYILGQEREKKWEILCAGSGAGPEPHQLGMELQAGGAEFQIEGIDISRDSVEQAQGGSGRTDYHEDFFQTMAGKGIIAYEPQKKEYRLAPELIRKMKFKQHDLLRGPAEADKQYDVIVCNNVLQHFPPATRELILANLLANLADGGILALERDHLEFNDAEEKAWLAPYYRWKKDLARFGLAAKKIEQETAGWGWPVTVFEYKRKKNKFRDKKIASRNNKSVEVRAH